MVAEVGELPTLASCGIGPPGAQLAFAGWLTVEDVGAAPPDAEPGEAFYALVPAGEVAWNPPGLSRRIMPAVRGRLACLSTLRGLAPTVVGLPAGWAPPPIPRHELFSLAECRVRPAGAPLAYRGWLTAEQLGEPAVRPLYAIVSERPVRWAGPTQVPWPPTREQRARIACVIDPETDEARAIVLADDWQPPRAN